MRGRSRRSKLTTVINWTGVAYRVHVEVGSAPTIDETVRVREICLFARFFGGGGPHEYEIEAVWHDDPTGSESPIEVYGPFSIFFRDGEPTRDYVFRLRNFPIAGSGRYAIQLIPLDDQDREPLAIEYFEVSGE